MVAYSAILLSLGVALQIVMAVNKSPELFLIILIGTLGKVCVPWPFVIVESAARA